MTDERRAELEKKWSVLKFFKYKHLPPVLQAFSAPLAEVAYDYADRLADCAHPAEVAVGLRKLKEAKDSFVCARLPESGEPIKS